MTHLEPALDPQVEAAPRYRCRFLVRRGSEFVALPATEVAYFVCDERLVFLAARDGRRFLLDGPLAELEGGLDPAMFFRLNRQYLASVAAIASFRPMGKGKLLVGLCPAPRGEVIVSQERSRAFRRWLAP
jgi:DNA-binding LytR/AlgR family response regulator